MLIVLAYRNSIATRRFRLSSLPIHRTNWIDTHIVHYCTWTASSNKSLTRIWRRLFWRYHVSWKMALIETKKTIVGRASPSLHLELPVITLTNTTDSLNLKITAAEAITTSITTNSVLWDYFNQNDQISRTHSESPGFKPFTLTSLKKLI